MKRLYFAITTFFLCAAILGGCKGGNASAPENTNTLLSQPDHHVSAAIPSELLALRFDGYENLSISEYRTKAFDVIAQNEARYLSLIEQASANSEIQAARYTDENAYFIANILIPTIAEKWNTWRFSQSITGGHYSAEYSISYNDTRIALTGDEMDFLKVTLEATSQELIEKYQNGSGLSTLRYRIEKQTGETVKGKNISVFELLIDYNITYSVLNDTKLTVGERDCALRAVKHGLENFADGRTIDELANGKAELETEITKLEQQYSSNKMQVTINIISYQAFDQRYEIQSLQ